MRFRSKTLRRRRNYIPSSTDCKPGADREGQRSGSRFHFDRLAWPVSPLDQYRGKYVVLEWHNQGCPFTRKHYVSGNMQALQKQWTGKGVVWLTVISSAPGAQGYVTAAQENDYLAKMHAAPTAALLDPDGKLGRLYDAKTTPDMFIIDPQGKLIYAGAIDNRPTPDVGDIQGADNYVSDALSAAMSGKSVAMPYTRAYGCSVKYRD